MTMSIRSEPVSYEERLSEVMGLPIGRLFTAKMTIATTVLSGNDSSTPPDTFELVAEVKQPGEGQEFEVAARSRVVTGGGVASVQFPVPPARADLTPGPVGRLRLIHTGWRFPACSVEVVGL